MKDKRVILVTAVGGDIGQGVAKILKKDTEDKILGCDIDLYAAGKMYVDKFFVAPKVSDDKRYRDFMNKLIYDEKITHIIPITECEIKYFNNHKEEFNKIKIVINNKEIIETFLDKLSTIKFLKENNIKFPKTLEINKYNGTFGLPVIVKEKSSRGGKGIYIINSDNELEYYKKNYPNAIVQEYIGDIEDEYTMSIFSDGKNINNISFRRLLGYGSMSKFVELINDEKLNKLAIQIATSCKLKGSINVQMRKHNGEYIPFEVNPRISSTISFRNRFGFKDITWWLDIIDSNIEIEYKPIYKKGIGVRIVDEIYFDFE